MIFKYVDEFAVCVRLAKAWHRHRHTNPRAKYWRDVHLEAARLALEKHYGLNGR